MERWIKHQFQAKAEYKIILHIHQPPFTNLSSNTIESVPQKVSTRDIPYVTSHGSLFYFYDFSFVDVFFIFSIALIMKIKKCDTTFYKRFTFHTTDDLSNWTV